MFLVLILVAAVGAGFVTIAERDCMLSDGRAVACTLPSEAKQPPTLTETMQRYGISTNEVLHWWAHPTPFIRLQPTELPPAQRERSPLW